MNDAFKVFVISLVAFLLVASVAVVGVTLYERSQPPTSPFALEVIEILNKSKVDHIFSCSDNVVWARFGNLVVDNTWRNVRVVYKDDDMRDILTRKEKQLILGIAIDKVKDYKNKKRQDNLKEISELSKVK